MNDLKSTPETQTPHLISHDLRVGTLLILLGVGLLVTRQLQIAWVPVWIIGLWLLSLGLFQHKKPLIFVGCIITGTGLAILVQMLPWTGALSLQVRTGLFMGCLALGWLAIPLFTRLGTSRTLWWPILPGLILASSGVAFAVSTGWLMILANYVWPSLLIAFGAYLIFRRLGHRR